ncbi:MAG: hypothetical protein WC389_22475 [Lutibacter sp.]|jgi:hypothetical protein
MTKYFLITDENENGDSFSEVIEGNTPEQAFENWFLNDIQGAKWEDLEFGGYFPLRDSFNSITLYPITGEKIEIDYQAFIDKHDKRTEEEKDPEYNNYIRLKNKFSK